MKIVEKTRKIRGLLGLKSNSFRAPDYEQALEEVVGELGHPIWVHGVRLPVDKEDLAYAEGQRRLEIERLEAE